MKTNYLYMLFKQFESNIPTFFWVWISFLIVFTILITAMIFIRILSIKKIKKNVLKSLQYDIFFIQFLKNYMLYLIQKKNKPTLYPEMKNEDKSTYEQNVRQKIKHFDEFYFYLFKIILITALFIFIIISSILIFQVKSLHNLQLIKTNERFQETIIALEKSVFELQNIQKTAELQQIEVISTIKKASLCIVFIIGICGCVLLVLQYSYEEENKKEMEHLLHSIQSNSNKIMDQAEENKNRIGWALKMIYKDIEH